MDDVQTALVRRQAMEINQDVRALITSKSDLPKTLSAYLIKDIWPIPEAVATVVEGDDDAEMCAALACKDVVVDELQRLMEALRQLEAQAAEETDAAKKAVLLVQCRVAANDLKVTCG